MRPFRTLLLTAVLVVIVAGGFAAKMAVFAFSPLRTGATESAMVEIRKGEPPSEVARAILAAGAIDDSRSFVWLGRVVREWRRIKAGEYRVSPAMTPLELFATLVSGISVAHPITVREGENSYEIADDIAAKDLVTREAFLAATRSSAILTAAGLDPAKVHSTEGYLFPDTYFFNRTMSAEDMVRQMLKKFQSVWNADYDIRATQLGLTRHQVVILASIVEKETGNPPDRPIISSVLHNRLAKKMRLQSDPTTIYGMWSRYKGNIHKSDLMDPSPYNTYFIAGLPVGPIGNPGVESIRAALFPANTRFFYFVSHNDGTTQFSETLAQHNGAVQKFQIDPKARAGKSWRDLNRKVSRTTNPSDMR